MNTRDENRDITLRDVAGMVEELAASVQRNVIEKMATKEDLKALETRIRSDMATKEDVQALKDDVKSLEIRMDQNFKFMRKDIKNETVPRMEFNDLSLRVEFLEEKLGIER